MAMKRNAHNKKAAGSSRAGMTNYFALLDEDMAPSSKKKNFSLGPSLIAQALFDETKTFHKNNPFADKHAADELGHPDLAERPETHEGDDYGEGGGSSSSSAGISGGGLQTRTTLASLKPADPIAAIRQGFGGGSASDVFSEAAAMGGAAKRGPAIGGYGFDDDADAAAMDFAAVANQLDASRKKGAAGAGASAGSGAEAAWDFSGLGLTAEEVKKRAEQEAAEKKARERQEAFEADLSSRVKTLSKTGDADELKSRMAKADLTHKQRVRRVMEVTRGSAFADRFNVRLGKQDSKKKARNKVKHL